MLVWIDFAIRIINLLSDFLGVYIRIARILSQIYLIQLVGDSIQLRRGFLPDLLDFYVFAGIRSFRLF